MLTSWDCCLLCCAVCKSGYGLAASKCTICPAGKYSDGTTDCQSCPAGKEPNGAKSACVDSVCGAGTYRTADAAAACVPCGYGKYVASGVNADASVCTACPDGSNTTTPTAGRSTDCKGACNSCRLIMLTLPNSAHNGAADHQGHKYFTIMRLYKQSTADVAFTHSCQAHPIPAGSCQS
jgi:hypothetical protein